MAVTLCTATIICYQGFILDWSTPSLGAHHTIELREQSSFFILLILVDAVIWSYASGRRDIPRDWFVKCIKELVLLYFPSYK